MKKASLGLLAFCLASSWAAFALGADAGDCTITAKNAEYDDVCKQCTEASDAGIEACRTNAKGAAKGLACTTESDGSIVEIWCVPSAGSSANAGNDCSTQAAHVPSSWTVLLMIGGLGAALELGRRRRRG